MDVKKISDEVRLNVWMVTISTCSESDLSVRKWCLRNEVSEPQYYYCLNRIRQLALDQSKSIIENEIVELPSRNHEPVQSCVTLYKGETKIEIPYDCSEYVVALLTKQLR